MIRKLRINLGILKHCPDKLGQNWSRLLPLPAKYFYEDVRKREFLTFGKRKWRWWLLTAIFLWGTIKCHEVSGAEGQIKSGLFWVILKDESLDLLWQELGYSWVIDGTSWSEPVIDFVRTGSGALKVVHWQKSFILSVKWRQRCCAFGSKLFSSSLGKSGLTWITLETSPKLAGLSRAQSSSLFFFWTVSGGKNIPIICQWTHGSSRVNTA